ncbi:hypothetical protein DPMN_047049 [Dreissena polymorpha]|uniref:Uncharacterized protein n=1 Tax=Dreissena polymorpha TaxID=45954 RepID=A0A9D4D950_DREPO|nr:hypothetical protein DPMN_047049 [Dreissena polymorpha]
MPDIVYDRKGRLDRLSESVRSDDDSYNSPWQQEGEDKESVLHLEVCEAPL